MFTHICTAERPCHAQTGHTAKPLQYRIQSPSVLPCAHYTSVKSTCSLHCAARAVTCASAGLARSSLVVRVLFENINILANINAIYLKKCSGKSDARVKGYRFEPSYHSTNNSCYLNLCNLNRSCLTNKQQQHLCSTHSTHSTHCAHPPSTLTPNTIFFWCCLVICSWCCFTNSCCSNRACC